ncbi:MAG: tRNA guanosine(34) transglycosylase Tgt [Anaerolineaceae bacterium]|nr:tRNA guanosine(34) transglycosylase Tgt [Anaerolineaceae bacterium]
MEDAAKELHERSQLKKTQPWFTFELAAREGKARAGLFHTPHGSLQTPVFAPVGTQAAIKGITTAQLEDIEATLVLANTYHLYLRPGEGVVEEMGGLHQFMNWKSPILTDSGGFQVFSLAQMRQVDDDGVTFRSHIDGSTHRFTPEKAIEIQEMLGADIIMAFDECAPPYEREYNQQAMERTHRWAERCLAAKRRSDQALFGIVQGGVFPELRQRSAEWVSSLGFPGNAIGGLSVGESKPEMHAMLDLVNDILPEDKPRDLMGVGSPEDLINGVLRGVDIFDCVLPTRLARHQTAITNTGRMNLMNAAFTRDARPIDESCECWCCQNFSRAYLRHLIVARETLAGTLISIHNLFTLLELMRKVRIAIMKGCFQEFADQYLREYHKEVS